MQATPHPQPGRSTGSVQSPSQAGVLVLGMAPQPIQPQTTSTTPSWEMLQAMPNTREVDLEKQMFQATQLLQAWTMSQVMLESKSFSLSWDPPILNLGHLGV